MIRVERVHKLSRHLVQHRQRHPLGESFGDLRFRQVHFTRAGPVRRCGSGRRSRNLAKVPRVGHVMQVIGQAIAVNC